MSCQKCGGEHSTMACDEADEQPKPKAKSSFAAPAGSAAELIASKELLRRWLKKYAPSNVPGAWDYDHDAVDLIETTAKLLGIEHPWRRQKRRTERTADQKAMTTNDSNDKPNAPTAVSSSDGLGDERPIWNKNGECVCDVCGDESMGLGWPTPHICMKCAKKQEMSEPSRQYAISIHAKYRDALAVCDRATLEVLAMMLIQKREVDGLNGRKWDSGAHLFFEDSVQSIMRNLKSPNAGTQRPGSPDGSLATETRKPGSLE